MIKNSRTLIITLIFLLFPVFLHASAAGTAGIEVWDNHKIIQTTGQKMEYLPVIKAGKDGGIYITEDPMKIEDKKVEMKDLPAVLARLHKKFRTIVYFREGTFIEPRGKYLRHIRQILDKLELEGFAIKMGDNYLDRYGEITNFTLHIAPDKFRLGADKGGVFVYAFVPKGKKKMKIYKSGLKDPAVWKENYALDFGMMFHSNRIPSSEQKNRKIAFMPNEMKMPSVHISVVIDGKHEWMACYAMDEVPPNVQSLIEDCKMLGKMYIKK